MVLEQADRPFEKIDRIKSPQRVEAKIAELKEQQIKIIGDERDRKIEEARQRRQATRSSEKQVA